MNIRDHFPITYEAPVITESWCHPRAGTITQQKPATTYQKMRMYTGLMSPFPAHVHGISPPTSWEVSEKLRQPWVEPL